MGDVYKFRLVLDTKEDIIRDVEISGEHCLEDFHGAILDAFGIKKGEMSAFYKSSEEWEQGEEIPLLDMGLTEKPSPLMCEFTIEQMINDEVTNMLYVYDFLNMWTFFVEFIAKLPVQENTEYPQVIFSHGDTPKEAPEKDFQGSKDLFEDAFGEEDAFDDEEFGHY